MAATRRSVSKCFAAKYEGDGGWPGWGKEKGERKGRKGGAREGREECREGVRVCEEKGLI